MQITFTFDSKALQRLRYIQVTSNTKPRYAIPPDPIYSDVHLFLQTFSASGFPFQLIALLHASAVKKLAYPASIPRFLRRTMLVSGALYLALNPRHNDLEIREIMGDFASGFSHDFGVGLTLLTASGIFDIPLDEFAPIDHQGQPALDYAAFLPNSQNLLQLEAKGVTSDESRSQARNGIYKKKQSAGNTVMLQTGPMLSSQQVLKLGIIVQAAYKKRQTAPSPRKKAPKHRTRGLLEIIDPPPDDSLRHLTKEQMLAGKYWHYAGIALFAGLPQVAEEFAQRAIALLKGRERGPRLLNYQFAHDMIAPWRGRQLIGIRWQLSDLPLGKEDVWFYQAADLSVLQTLLQTDRFPQTYAYHPDAQAATRENIAESFFSDGSYFGIGLRQLEGLQTVDEEPQQQSFW
jgi:hypothetical protein